MTAIWFKFCLVLVDRFISAIEYVSPTIVMNEKNHSVSQTSSSSSQRTPKYFYQFRLILIGDSTVGKSSLIRQFTEGNFVDLYPADPTVGVDFHVRVIELSGLYIKSQQQTQPVSDFMYLLVSLGLTLLTCTTIFMLLS